MTPGESAKRRRSSALVITLLGVVLLTIIVIAFMQTMSLALSTSKSYADIRRATLAAQAGLDTAIAQISLATATNMAFVTGVTNFPSTNTPVTVIGVGNLTNLDQMMPLVSGQITYLTNFGNTNPGPAEFTNNFYSYASSLLTNAAGYATNTVDVNTPYGFIQGGISATDTNTYRAPWVTMTNVVGSQTSYTRYAYVVLDDSARVNPTLMTGAGNGYNGYTNSTNWYTGPQDVGLTYLSNNFGALALSASQIQQVTNSPNSFGYSDATLGVAVGTRAIYETNKYLFTSQTNASFDMIPAWYPDGAKGLPKYNINDLATNTAYGSITNRAAYIASIITNNLPNFYMRDPALNATSTNYVYVQRLAANIVTYINSTNNPWPASEYTTNTSGVSPQVNGVFPVTIVEQSYAPTGGKGTPTHSSATVANAFWLNCWNPYTTPVTITHAVLHVWNQASYQLGASGSVIHTPDYTQTNSYISDTNGVVRPNEFVTLGFPPVTNTISGPSTTDGPTMVADGYNGLDSFPYEQYSLTIINGTNSQTVAQSANQPNTSGLDTDEPGWDFVPSPQSGYTLWDCNEFSTLGSEVGDPRFQNYEYTIWACTHGFYSTATFWNGYPYVPGKAQWLPFPQPSASNSTNNNWVVRDNIARSPASAGNTPSGGLTPDQYATPAPYSSSDSNAAPEVIRNGPMVSIGELGHVFDPAYANDVLTATPPSADGGGYSGAYLNGGGRSLRIGRPEATSTAGAQYSWTNSGEPAINLLDLFTVNNTNTSSTTGATNINVINTNMLYGGAVGRINPNTASSNVLAAVFSGIQITSDPTLTNSSGGPTVLTNVPAMASNVIANRPYSCLSDLYKTMPIFDAYTNYYPNFTLNTSGYLNVFNRVHQEAFGKWVQHLTVQSRAYRIYVIGQVLDSSQNPHGSVAMEVGIYLQYNPTELRYDPVIQYLHILK